VTSVVFLIERALALHQQGQIKEALGLYKSVLEREPRHSDALHLAGLAELSMGNVEVALAYVQQAIEAQPRTADFHNSLGQIWQAKGRMSEAIDAYREVLEIDRKHVEARNNLALVLKGIGHKEEAVEELQHCIALDPTRAQLHLNLGSTLMGLQRIKEAERAFRAAVRFAPGNAAALTSLANALYALGQLDEAYKSLTEAIEYDPSLADAHTLLGLVLQDAGRFEEAVASHRKALDLRPSAGVLVNLGNTWRAMGKLDEAINAYRQALDKDPTLAQAWSNLGICLRDRSEHAAAQKALEKALEIRPKYLNAHTNLLILKLTDGRHTPKEVFAEHQVWEERYAKSLYEEIKPFPNEPDPKKRLRIGYLSSDLRNHPIAYNVEPLLAGHDRKTTAVFIYSSVVHEDETTLRIKSMVDGWCNLVGVDDRRAAEKIRADGIDILVLLGGHFDSGRLLVTALKPAPIIVSFHDITTSGLKTVDYLFSDTYLTPPGHPEHFTERLFKLPRFYVFRPPENAPEVGPPPFRSSGSITFGSFNNPSKLTENMVEVWAEILKRVPGSRLFLKYRTAFANPGTQQRFADLFSRNGVDPARIQCAGHDLDMASHLAAYNHIDIALDPSPFNGSTTTRDALWMGVPVVTLAGEVMLSRAGAQTLSQVGLSDLIADTEESYILKAVQLAGSLERLNDLRHSLRDTVRRSSLCAGDRYVRHVERAYRAMWGKWCKEHRG